jgi:hypothetical protein
VRKLLLLVPVGTLVTLLFVPLLFAPGDFPASATGPAGAGIPPRALQAYMAASAACPGLRWELLAGIGQVESAHGRNSGASIGPDGVVTPTILGPVLDGSGSAGNTTPLPIGRWANQWGLGDRWQQALGPMQLLPSTFDAWFVDGDGDGRRNPHDIDDAAATAAAYLCGAARQVSDERAAVLRYNHSDAYASEVLAREARYAQSTAPLVLAEAPSIDAVLGDPRIVIYPAGRADIAAGRIDPRVLRLLASLAVEHTLTVTSLQTGHPRCAVNGQAPGPACAVSNHFFGRAADIGAVDGAVVSARNATALAVMRQLAAFPDGERPDEIGGPVDVGGPGVFSGADHAGHIHVGFSA